MDGPETIFIKITISQYHDIDISYIDIDIGKNVFSMTSLVSTPSDLFMVNMSNIVQKWPALIRKMLISMFDLKNCRADNAKW